MGFTDVMLYIIKNNEIGTIDDMFLCVSIRKNFKFAA